MSIKIQEGYKQTEVGIIPDDWEVKTFRECFEFLSTGSQSRSELSEYGNVGYIHYGDIHTKWNLVLDCDQDNFPLINKEKVKELPILKDGDLIIADASEDYEGVGISIEIKNVRDREIVAGLHTLLLRADPDIIANGFTRFITSIKYVKQSLQKIATGISVYGISKTNLKNIAIPIPPTIEEQKAIAQSLSDVDTLITALDQVITKKRNIKQGTMQQVLTGKKRLPGFIGEWEVKTLGELGCPGRPAIKAGPFGSSLKKEFYVEKGYKIYGQEQVIAGDLSIGNYYIDSYLFEKLKSCEIRPNDILISLVGTFGKVIVVPDNIERGIINPRLLRLSLDSNWVYPYFLQYWLISSATQKLLSETSHGGTMGIINAKVLSVLSILLPLIPEQKAIAQVLSDIEAEIEALEKKRDKYKAIKQGMMQELLTEKTRLKYNLDE